jgi:hypothetical protein
MRSPFLLLAVAAGLAGCGRGPSAGKAVGNVGGIACEVRGHGGGVTSDVRSETRGTAHTARGVFAAGGNKLVVEDGRIVANGRPYGTAKSGDSVLLDEQGRLSVNGQERQPTADRAPDGTPPAPSRKGE